MLVWLFIILPFIRCQRVFKETNLNGNGNEYNGGECRLDLGGEGAIVVLFCKKLPQLNEIFCFIREMNEPVMAIRDEAFHKYLYQSSCTCL